MRRHSLAVAFALLLVGCGRATDDATLDTLRDDAAVRVSSRERLEVDVRPAEPIKLGKNTVVVTFPPQANAELASVSALMPAHGHGSPAPTIERTADGFLVSDLVLFMSGRWELRLGLRVGSAEDEAVVEVDVP